MEIKIFGTRCHKCNTLEQFTRAVVDEMGIDAPITKVEDLLDIINSGVMRTPALMVNGKVLVWGRVPEKDEIRQLISDARE